MVGTPGSIGKPWLQRIHRMKRHPALIPLSHDHRQGLFLAQILKPGVPRYAGAPATIPAKHAYLLQQHSALLHPHCQVETNILLPAVQGVDEELDALLAASRRDYAAIDAHIAHIAALPADWPELETPLHELGLLLEQHIRTQERQLFQRIQAVIDEPALAHLGQRLRSHHAATCARQRPAG
jgi:hypothetical protein